MTLVGCSDRPGWWGEGKISKRQDWPLGRVEKTNKNGSNYDGYCFFGWLMACRNKEKYFFGQRKFFVGWNST